MDIKLQFATQIADSVSFVHDKDELDELCNRLLALTGIEKVERYDTE